MTGAGLDREKVVRILGMLGSAHDGEVLAAARQAERLRREAGASWGDIILPALAPAEPTREREIASNEDAISFCLDFHHALTAWENTFLESIVGWPDHLSDKQLGVLARIVAKCRLLERAAA